MNQPSTHRWLPVYTSILLGGIGVTIYEIFKASKHSGSMEYVILGVILVAIRVGVCWGIYTRKLWGWYSNFVSLFAIPFFKGLIVINYSSSAHKEHSYGAFFLALAFWYVVYALPNVLYFRKRKYLFDDGTGPHKMMFGNGFRVLDPFAQASGDKSEANDGHGSANVSSERTAVVHDPGTQEIVQFSGDSGGEVALGGNQEMPSPQPDQNPVPPEREIACPSCGVMNEANAHYCGECCAALLRKCPECGVEDSSAKQFCISCGTDEEGFLAAQELLHRVEKHAADKEWRLLLAESENWDAGIRVPGKKGTILRERITSEIQMAQKSVAAIEKLETEIVTNAKQAELRKADGLSTSTCDALLLRHLDALKKLKSLPDNFQSLVIETEKRVKGVEEKILSTKKRYVQRVFVGIVSSILVGLIGYYLYRLSIAKIVERKCLVALEQFQEGGDLISGFAAFQNVDIKGCMDTKASVVVEDDEAVEWHRKIEEEGDAYAVQWLLLAAEKGNFTAQNFLGVMFSNGKGVSENHKEAVKWFRKAAEQGYVHAQINIGLSYEEGDGVAKDYSRAIGWYRLAAEQGDDQALERLVQMYSHGKGADKYSTEAAKWYWKAAERGIAEAQFNLGVIYGVTKDYATSERLIRLAAEQGYSDAQYKLGEMYYSGWGKAVDFVEAEKWMRLAAEKNNTAAAKWYRKVVKSGDPDMQNTIGEIYEKGWGIAEDDKEALKWFKKAAEQGNSKAQYNLGRMYYYSYGVASDVAEADKWFRLAAERGNVDAQVMLGLMYNPRRVGLADDVTESAKWFQLAAEQGDAFAQRHLAAMYWSGEGVRQSYEDAAKWYLKAAKQGDLSAQETMVAIYKDGIGIHQDDAERWAWYEIARENGSEECTAQISGGERADELRAEIKSQ